MVCVRVDCAQHCPVDATPGCSAVEKRWRCRIDSQIPSWQLSLINVHSHSTRGGVTYIAITDILCVRRHYATVEATFAVLLQVFVWYTRIAILGTDDRVITGPELEGNDVSGKGVDTVRSEEMCSVADFDGVYGDLALLYHGSSRIDGSRRAVDVLARYEAWQGSKTQGM